MASILERIQQAETLSPYIKCLIYGDPGSGKTIFSCTAPQPLLLDCENSSLSLLDWPVLAQETQVLKIKNFNEMDEVFWELKAGNIPNVQTVVVDTISELQRKNMDAILISGNEKDPGKSPFVPYQNDYKLSTEVLRRILTAFRDLDYHLIVTAHRIEDTDDSKRQFVRPEVTPKLASTLKGVFDLQAFLTYEIKEQGGVETFINTLRTRQSRRVEAKTRMRYLPTNIEMPTFDDILKANQQTMLNLNNHDASKEQNND